jgi:RimJ/RimL family protein N-acetyltransferase
MRMKIEMEEISGPNQSKAKGPAYRIHTERLVLRCWYPGDAPLLKAAIDTSLEHLRPWMAWAKQEPESLETKIERLRKFRGQFDLDQDYLYGILNREESAVLGGTGLHSRRGEGVLEIGYWIHVDHINQGLATETAGALTKVAFEVNRIGRVEIHCDPLNARSATVPRKLGFVHEATLRQRTVTPDGKPRDSMIWTMLAAEYPVSNAVGIELEAFDVIGHQIL